MGDKKENEEAGQGVPTVVGENQQLVDAQVQVQPEASSAPVPVEETSNCVQDGSNHAENGRAEPPADAKVEPPAVDKVESRAVDKAESPAEAKEEPPAVDKVEPTAEESLAEAKVEPPTGAKIEPPAEDKSVEPEAEAVSEGIPHQDVQNTLHLVPVEADAQILDKTECEEAADTKTEAEKFPQSNNKDIENEHNLCQNNVVVAETVVEVKPEACEVVDSKTCDNVDPVPSGHNEPTTPQAVPADTKAEIKNVLEVENKADENQATADNANSNSKHMFFLDADHSYDGNESGTEEEQSAFMKELENFFRERSMEFKPPKFYGEGLNCLKLWRAVTRLGGYDKVTSCKLWRQVGESFKPPKTCTTVSWTFRGFYEKALLDYERHKIKGGELNVPIASHPEPMNIENQASASGRARRDAAARAMQGWHSQRLLGNGEVSDPIIKDRNSVSMQKREKQLKSINLLKRKKPSYMDNAVKAARSKPSKPQLDTAVVDIGPPADWVKVNVLKAKDCFEVYALVPGLLREEVRVQSDPAGRLVISGEPEHPNNPWGVTPFKKVVSLPSRIDPHQTSAVVTLHGQLFVRVPFEQSE